MSAAHKNECPVGAGQVVEIFSKFTADFTPGRLNDTDRAIDALNAIPNNLPNDDWFRVSTASKAAGVDFADWLTWCQGASNFKSESDCRARWKSIDATGPIQAGTLYKTAAEYGWRTGAKPAPARTIKPAEPQRKPAPGQSAAEVWSRCLPVQSHPYAEKKRLSAGVLNQLRVVPDTDRMNIAGQSMAGALAVPAFAPDGAMQSIQFIPAAGGDKLNLPGVPMAGASLTFGTEGPIHLCEGMATAAAVWQSTGHRAVCCFSWGKVGKIAAALRQQEPDAKLLICPDVGKESDAQKIADKVGAVVAALPEGWDNNSDLNDVFCSPDGGFDVVCTILETASEPPKPKPKPKPKPEPEPKVHPLARYVDIDGTAKPPRWVIPGFIGHGVTVIAGAHGVGKTTALLPLAMTAAGLHGDELMPRQWRHVVYVTEDVEQARRILAGVTLHSNLGIDLGLVRERVHIVEAVRLDPVFVASVGATYREQFTRTVEGVEVLPLVVLDTKSAVLALDNENDNSEASRMMAALKQGFDRLPVWLIGHVAKANLTRNDALTSRGASAIEGDANQTMFLIREGDTRFLVQGKTRFEAKWPELEITSYTAQTAAPDEFGNMETVLLRWGIAAPAQTTRKEAKEQAAEQQRTDDASSLRQNIRDAVEVAWMAGNPLNRVMVKAAVKGRSQTKSDMIENLLSERWLWEVPVPPALRAVNSKTAFLVHLTTEEHEAVLSGGGLPDAKLVIPASWQKQAAPLVPAPEKEVADVEHA